MRGPVPVAADAHHCIALVAHAGIVQYGHLQELAASPLCSQECYMLWNELECIFCTGLILMPWCMVSWVISLWMPCNVVE